MTRTKLLIPAIVAAVAIAGFWFLIAAPKREEITKLDTEITTQEAAAASSEQLAAGYAQSKAGYRRNYATMVRLGKAVPGDDDVRSLLVQIGDAAARSRVSFRSLDLGSGGATVAAPGAVTTGDGLAPAPGAVAIGSAGFSTMPFKFAFSGSFFRLSDFFQRLERFVTVQNGKIDVTGRLLLLGSISLAPDDGDLDKLDAQVGAATYIVPPTEGVPGAATPAAAVGGTPASAAGATVPTPTTATITGAR